MEIDNLQIFPAFLWNTNYYWNMSRMSLKIKFEVTHQRLNRNNQVKGSILCRESGEHISSNIPEGLPGEQELSACIAKVFHEIYKCNGFDEGSFHLKDKVQFYLRYIPSKY